MGNGGEMRILDKRTNSFLMFVWVILIGAGLAAPTRLEAQATVSTGAVTGIVSDPQGAVVPGAKVTISNKETGFSVTLNTGASGLFNLGSAAPGTYTVRVE